MAFPGLRSSIPLVALCVLAACQIQSTRDGESTTIEVRDGDEKATIELGDVKLSEDGIEIQGSVVGEDAQGEGAASGRISIGRDGIQIVGTADGSDGEERGEAAGSVSIGPDGVRVTGDASGNDGEAAGSVILDREGIRVEGDSRDTEGTHASGAVSVGPEGITINAVLPTSCRSLCAGWGDVSNREVSCSVELLERRGFPVGSTGTCQSVRNELECLACSASLELSSGDCSAVTRECLN